MGIVAGVGFNRTAVVFPDGVLDVFTDDGVHAVPGSIRIAHMGEKKMNNTESECINTRQGALLATSRCVRHEDTSVHYEIKEVTQ